MEIRVFRSCKEPIREDLPWEGRWKGDEKVLITCWEVGRELSKKNPKLAERTCNGELPVLDWKGGVEKKLQGKKHGTFSYLAQWQGLRGEDLDIDSTQDTEITCSKTGMKIIFTNDENKYCNE